MVKVRPWAYRIWAQSGYGPLMTLPRDGAGLEALVAEHGEMTVALAWYIFIVECEGRLWHQEPVEHVDEFTTKSGKKIVRTVEDQSAVTKFPLAAFLAVPDGCIVAVQDAMRNQDWRTRHKKIAEIVEGKL